MEKKVNYIPAVRSRIEKKVEYIAGLVQMTCNN